MTNAWSGSRGQAVDLLGRPGQLRPTELAGGVGVRLIEAILVRSQRDGAAPVPLQGEEPAAW